MRSALAVFVLGDRRAATSPCMAKERRRYHAERILCDRRGATEDFRPYS